MLCVGGPAAEDQIVLTSLIPSIKSKFDNIIYITKNYLEANVNHSAKQSHARHGNALNADSSLAGHALLWPVLKRLFWGIKLDEVLKPDFKKVDVKLNSLSNLLIYFGNEVNWVIQELKKWCGKLTEHDINRIESVLSQEILHVVERESKKELSGNANRSKGDSSSIHVVFTERNKKEVEHENQQLMKANIKYKELFLEEIREFFGKNPNILTAYKYFGDTHIKFNIHELNKEIAEHNGAMWLESTEIKRILINKGEDGNAELAGVIINDNSYLYANYLHFTGGYKASFKYDQNSKTRFESKNKLRNILNRIYDVINIKTPLKNNLTTATGVSINAVFKKNERSVKLIEKYGSIGEIAITNSHWTMIAASKDYILVRITGGGNTGSEKYQPSYFLNVIANTRRIFRDDLIGIYSAYGCSRAINFKNTTEFAKVAKNTIISYGKGGTGNTKRHIEAVTALIAFGFEKEVVEFLNTRQANLGNRVLEMHKHIKSLFFYDLIKRTNKRMGYA